MLEQVRETGAAGLLVLGSDVVPQVDGHNRAPVILVDQHVEAVVEPVACKRNVHMGPWDAPRPRGASIRSTVALATVTCARVRVTHRSDNPTRGKPVDRSRAGRPLPRSRSPGSDPYVLFLNSPQVSIAVP